MSRRGGPPHASGRGGLLRTHGDFRRLWCGETTGKFGASVTSVSMPLIAVATLNAGPFTVGLLTAASWAPWLLIGLPAGAWVDRLPRRPVMLAAAAVSLVLFAALPLAASTGRLSVPLLLAVALLTGTAAVFFQTAYTAYLPTLLAPEERAEGNAKLQGSASAAQIAGLGTGGLIADLAGAVNAMYVNAATFLVSLLCLGRIRHREPRGTAKAARTTSLVGEVADGLRLVARDPWLRPLTLFGAASNLALMGYQSIQVVFLVRGVGVGPGGVGVLVAATSVGGVAGAFLARGAVDRFGTARALLLFELGFAIPALLMPLAFGGAGLALFVAGGFSVTAGVVAGNVIASGFRQRYCPPELRGRLAASAAFLAYGTIPLGALLGGTLGSVLGPRAALALTSAGVPLAALILRFSPIGRTRDLPLGRERTADGPAPAAAS
ncbi:MFS transporter [Streptomyces sp. NPDC088923]|uniref:MFS transporter n=1 Tax=Streptomyces sp. NPDC088923 TaxID=3365913 RepID=UPI00382B8014